MRRPPTGYHNLRTLPGALVQPSDGRTLASTATASVDLLHAQKVFVYLDFATMVGYFSEMIRVARPGGVIAFDIVSERCLDDEILEMWVNVGHTLHRPIPREWVVDYFRRRDVTFIGDHRAILSGGKSDLLVFDAVEVIRDCCQHLCDTIALINTPPRGCGQPRQIGPHAEAATARGV
jgi:hypothetical protein